MHVDEVGDPDGRPALLVHGGGVGGWMWEPLLSHLTGDHRLIVPDLPGHDSSADEDYVSHDRSVARLIDLLESRCAAPVTVIGFSLGAQLAVLLASRRPDLVGRVIAVSALAVPTPARGATLALLGATVGLAGHEGFARLQARGLSVPPAHVEDYVRTSTGLSRATLLAAVGENLRFVAPARWARFPGPALILAGAREGRAVRTSAAVLHEALPGSTLEIVRGSGHDIPLRRPAWLARRLREWIGEAGPGARSS